MTVSQLLSTISSRELTEWQEYFVLKETEAPSISASSSSY